MTPKKVIVTFWGIFYVPHELTHYLTIWYWSESISLDIVPPRVRAALKEGTPVTAVRIDAIAPLIVFGVIWHLFVTPASIEVGPIVGTLIILGYSFWMLPSFGDWQIFLDAKEVRNQGEIPGDLTLGRTANVLFAVFTPLVPFYLVVSSTFV